MSTGAIIVHVMLFLIGACGLIGAADSMRWWKSLLLVIVGVAALGTSVALLVRAGVL